jgi:DNA-binding transcriptional MerR regulator
MSELKIGELSAAAATGVATIRYYERAGLLPPARRASGRHRIYVQADIERLKYVRRCRELGFTLEEIRCFASIAKAPDSQGACRAIVDRRLTAVKSKLSELRTVQSRLESLLAQPRRNRCEALDVF